MCISVLACIVGMPGNISVEQCKTLSLLQMAQQEHLQMQRSECVVHCSPASLWQHGYQQPLQLSHLLCHPCEGRTIGYIVFGFFLWHPVPSVVKTNAIEVPAPNWKT